MDQSGQPNIRPVTVGQLRRLLASYPDDSHVILQLDPTGDEFSPLFSTTKASAFDRSVASHDVDSVAGAAQAKAFKNHRAVTLVPMNLHRANGGQSRAETSTGE